MIYIPQNIIDAIFEQAQKENPIEACGYLAGKGDSVTTHFPMTNADQSSEHFTLDPREQFAVLKKARELDLDLVGVYHSHPFSPARPSEEDLKLAFDPEIHYVIASLLDETIKSFRIRDHKAEKEDLEII